MFSLILYGRKSLELQKWRHLRFAVTLFRNESAFSVNPSSPNVLSDLSNSFSSASAAAAADVSLEDGRKGQNFTVSYLVDSLGFTTKVAESIWRKVSLEGKGNPDSVLSLLRSHEFTDSQISTIITNYPRVLILDAESSLGPNLHFLQSRGASSFELTEIVSKVPRILGMRLQKTVSRYYDFVKDIIEADKSSKHQMSCLSLPQGTAQDNIIRNVLLLRQMGVPQRLLLSLLTSTHSIVSGKERFEDTIKKVVGMGFDPTTSKFVQALQVFYDFRDETIEEKTNAYKRLGFDVEYVWAVFKKWPLFLAYSEKKIADSIETYLALGFTRDEFTLMVKRNPICIGYSAETVKKKTEFLVKQMDWSLKAVVSHPQIYSYSMEKRMVPRCNVIKALMSKGLMGSELPSLSAVFAITDQAFLDKYVMKPNDKELEIELMAIFTRDCVT